MAAKRAPKGPNPTVLLAQGLVTRLKSEKTQSTSPFPWTLRQLVTAVASDATLATVEKAVKNRAFTDYAFLVKPPSGRTYPIAKAIDSPVALWEDAEELAGSRFTLEFLVREQPASNVAQITKGVCAKPRKDFQLALGVPLSAFLYDALAMSLLAVLREQRQHGETSYPVTVARLASLANRVDPSVVLEAIGRKAFTEVAFVLSPPRSGGRLTATQQKTLLGRLVVLKEDGDTLMASRALLENAIRDCRDKNSVAFTLDELARKHFKGFVDKRWAAQFVQSVTESMSKRTLPATVAWIKKSGKPCLFLIEDLSPPALGQRLVAADGVPPCTATPFPGPTSTFPLRFDTEFRRLDGERGANNFVWLLDLRSALPEFTREQFDGELRHLREARRYKLNAGEGRYGMSEEQRAASIREAGTVYLSVSRIDT